MHKIFITNQQRAKDEEKLIKDIHWLLDKSFAMDNTLFPDNIKRIAAIAVESWKLK